MPDQLLMRQFPGWFQLANADRRGAEFTGDDDGFEALTSHLHFSDPPIALEETVNVARMTIQKAPRDLEMADLSPQFHGRWSLTTRDCLASVSILPVAPA